MNPKTKGALAILVSAFLYGVSPALGKLTYIGGSNGLMLTLFRGVFAFPLLFVLMKIKRIPIRITRRNVRDLLLMGTLGSACTTALFYYSFEMIPVSLATVLNCTYPFFVVLYSMVVLRERATKSVFLALVMAMAGVVMFSDYTAGGEMRGILIALGSAASLAFVMIYQYRSSLVELHPLQLSFWLCIVMSVAMIPLALLTGRFTLSLSRSAWIYTIIVSILLTVFALSLLQYGLPLIGSSTTSILNMLEPVTSVAMGVFFLQESMTALKLAGCALILGAVALLMTSARKRAVVENAT